MPFQPTVTTYLLLMPLVFLAAVVDAVGGGGGLISLPAYTLIGLDYGFASGCNKFSAFFGTLSATVRYVKSGRIQWKPAVFAIIGTMPGAYIGTRVSQIVGTKFMSIFMLCAIPCVAVFMLLKKDRPDRVRPVTKLTLALCLGIGLLTGFYDGFFGPGTGTFQILLLNALTGMDMVSASATSKTVNLASNLTSLVTRLFAGQVIFLLAVPATAMSILGGQIGSKLALTRGAKFIRYIMLLVLALLIIKLVAEMIG